MSVPSETDQQPPASEGGNQSIEETWAADDAGPVSIDTSAELAPGVALGRYVVLRTIGHGGMGVVYQAYDPQLDRSVAVKLLLGTQGPQGTLGRQRLVREAQSMASISHPNVIAVHDVGTIGDRVFFAMEYVDGEELSDWLASAPRDVNAILDVFDQAGAGMAAAHEARLVHRDFKPANVLVDGRGRARVLDFGLAQRGAGEVRSTDSTVEEAADGSVDLTKTGALMGTPAYMAPEQFNGEPTDERSDQFSFCVSLYEALVGQRPFAGDTLPALTASVITGARRVQERPDGVPPTVWSAILRGLSQDRKNRYESMDALLAALRDRPRSRRALWWGAAALACGTTALVWTQVLDPEPKPCASAGVAMDEAWGEAQRTALLGGFAETGKPYAADTAERVSLRLDIYATRWREASAQACEMTKVRRERSEALYAKAEDCLAERRAAFVSVVDELTAIQPDAVLDSLEKTLGLPELAECSDRNLLEVRVAAPEDPQLRAQVALIDEGRQEAAAALKRGDTETCIAKLDALQTAVDAAEHPASVAAVQFVRSGCLHGAGQVDAAATLELRVFESALAASDDLTAIKVSALMAHRLAVATEDLDTAETWLRRAEALAQRHALDAPHLTAPMLNVRGVLLARRGQTDAAVEVFSKIRDITENVEGLEQQHLSGTQNAGVALANAGKLKEAREILERARDESTAIWGPSHPQVGMATSVLAKLRLKEGATEEAVVLLEASLAIAQQHATPYDISLAYDLHALGLAKRQLGKNDEAIPLYERALEQRETAKATDTVEATEMMAGLAQLYIDAGRGAEARGLLERVREIRDRVGATSCERGEVYSALAGEAVGSGKKQDAIRWGRTAVELGREGPSSNYASCGDVILRGAEALLDAGEQGLVSIFAEGHARLVEDEDEALSLDGLLVYAGLLAGEGEAQKAVSVAARVEELATTDDRKDALAEARRLLKLWRPAD